MEELTAAPSVDPVAADPVASLPSSPRPDAQPTSPPPARSERPTVNFQVEGREEEEGDADYQNPPMTPSPVRTMRHPVLAATQVRHTPHSYQHRTQTTLPLSPTQLVAVSMTVVRRLIHGTGVDGALPSRHGARVAHPADSTGTTATVTGTTAEQGMH
jgi:hypothetical protein